jgi:hypothetical protein
MQPARLLLEHTRAGLLLLLACVLIVGPARFVLASEPVVKLRTAQLRAAELYSVPQHPGELAARLPAADLHITDLRPARLHIADLRPAKRSASPPGTVSLDATGTGRHLAAP